MRQPLVAGNWKLNGSLTQAASLVDGIVDGVAELAGVEAAVCPVFVHLGKVLERTGSGPVGVGAQDVSDRESGAYTGEVAAWMLAEMGVRYAIVGHSERRARFGENDGLVAAKCRMAHSAGLTPIVCLGESLEERDGGNALEVVSRQLRALIAGAGDAIDDSVIAYEPIWAIGTGRSATPEQAQEVHAALRAVLRDATSAADRIKILYGGSVKAANAASLFGQADIDGALVGGASLDADEFLGICRAAAASAAERT